MRISYSLLVFSLGATLVCASALRAQNLPDAPPPPPLGPQPDTPASHAPVPATRAASVEALNKRQWSSIVEPGEKIPPLSARQKLLFPLHEEARPEYSLLPIVLTSEYGNLRGTDPKLGSNGLSFAERVGDSALRQFSTRVFADSLLPIAFHQDPRYYREGYGTYRLRARYAIERVFITQSDRGARELNYSDVLGRGMSAALTQTYYPSRSLGAGVVGRSWALSLGSLGAGNLFQEFWPDVKRKVFHASQ